MKKIERYEGKKKERERCTEGKKEKIVRDKNR